MSRRINAHVLFDDPLVIYDGIQEGDDMCGFPFISPTLSEREVVYVILICSNAAGTWLGYSLANLIKSHQKMFPLHTHIVFCNTEDELAFFRSEKIAATLCNQNCLVSNNSFYVTSLAEKKYDAVYNAQLDPCKRHELCSDIGSLALIYWNYSEETVPLFHKIKGWLPHATFINEVEGQPANSIISVDHVVRILNQSHVGLCLSAEEGAMYASIEYLLCGIPVVTTPSIGGRDLFFDEDYVATVEPEPRAIAEAVRSLIERAPPASEIRARTIAKQQQQISHFIGTLDGVIKRRGGVGYDQNEWDRRYRDKLQNWQPLDRFLSEILPLSRPMPRARKLKRKLMRAAGLKIDPVRL